MVTHDLSKGLGTLTLGQVVMSMGITNLLLTTSQRFNRCKMMKWIGLHVEASRSSSDKHQLVSSSPHSQTFRNLSERVAEKIPIVFSVIQQQDIRYLTRKTNDSQAQSTMSEPRRHTPENTVAKTEMKQSNSSLILVQTVYFRRTYCQ